MEEFNESLFAGRSGIGEHAFGDLPEGRSAGVKFSRTARVRGFRAEDLLTAGQVMGTERSGQFALVSAAEAMEQAHLMGVYGAERVGVVMGCSTGGRSAEEAETGKLYLRMRGCIADGGAFDGISRGEPSGDRAWGDRAGAEPIHRVCIGSHAIGLAFQMVRSGMVEAAVCGGHEAPLTWGFLRRGTRCGWCLRRSVDRSRRIGMG